MGMSGRIGPGLRVSYDDSAHVLVQIFSALEDFSTLWIPASAHDIGSRRGISILSFEHSNHQLTGAPPGKALLVRRLSLL